MAGKIDKDAKELVISILEVKSIEYEEWLNEQHQKLIVSNFEILKQGLSLKKELAT